MKSKPAENPFHKFDAAFALMAIVPMLGFVFVITRDGSWKTFEGRQGFIILLLIVISLLGYWLGYRVIRRLFEQIVNYNRAISRMNELKSIFVSEVSHEVRNPLVTLQMGLSFLKEDVTHTLTEEQRQVIAGCGRSVERMIRLTTDILDLAKIEAAAMPVKSETVFLRPLLEEAAGFMKPHVDKKHLIFTGEFGSGEHALSADRDHLTRVIINLMDNAIKYTPEGRGVGVRLIPDKRFFEIDVWNEGDEIPAAKKEEIFERYRRIATDKETGAGLGLAIVKELVQLHRGGIRLERSDERNHFIVRLPRVNVL